MKFSRPLFCHCSARAKLFKKKTPNCPACRTNCMQDNISVRLWNYGVKTWGNLGREIPSSHCWGCGARLCGSKSNAIKLILRLFLYHFLHTMSSWHQESIHNNTNNQQTPPPWWWSCSPLQRRGFDESTPSKWQAALRVFFSWLLLKGLVQFNKLM